MEIVTHKGGIVQYHDPHIPELVDVQTGHALSLKSIPLTADNLQQADVVVLTTNHSSFDVDFIQQHAKMIVDMRNMVKEGNDKVYKL